MKDHIYVRYFCDESLMDLMRKEFKNSFYSVVFDKTKDLNETDFIIFQNHSMSLEDEEKLISAYRDKIIILSDQNDIYNLDHYLGKLRVFHLIGLNGNSTSYELRACLEKKISQNIWGIDNYLYNDATVKTRKIPSVDLASGIINKLIDEFNLESYFSSFKDYLKLMANEMVTNSFYSYHKTANEIKKEQDVHFQVGMDKSFFIFSAIDHCGGIKSDTVIDNLLRSFKTKKVKKDLSGGAGLGIYFIFSHSSQLIINCQENIKTEFICILEKNKRFKDYKERITSFHFHKRNSDERETRNSVKNGE